MIKGLGYDPYKSKDFLKIFVAMGKSEFLYPVKQTYGESIDLTLFLCGYFDAGYLGYEAAEGIDWVWEHRIDDMEQLLG